MNIIEIIMRKIEDTIYYTTSEVIAKTGIAPSTLFRQLKEKKIPTKMYLGTYLISATEVQNLEMKKEIKQHEIIITNYDINHGTLRGWLSKKENLNNLKKWSEGGYNEWNLMNSEDYLAYYCFLILPIWKKEGGYIHIKPSNKWLIDCGFKGFVQSFNNGYLKSENIDTLQDFFNKIVFKRIL